MNEQGKRRTDSERRTSIRSIGLQELCGYFQIKIIYYSFCADLGLVSIVDVWRKPIKYRDLPNLLKDWRGRRPHKFNLTVPKMVIKLLGELLAEI